MGHSLWYPVNTGRMTGSIHTMSCACTYSTCIYYAYVYMFMYVLYAARWYEHSNVLYLGTLEHEISATWCIVPQLSLQFQQLGHFFFDLTKRFLKNSLEHVLGTLYVPQGHSCSHTITPSILTALAGLRKTAIT